MWCGARSGLAGLAGLAALAIAVAFAAAAAAYGRNRRDVQRPFTDASAPADAAADTARTNAGSAIRYKK